MAKHTILPIICAGALLFSACGKTSESAEKSTEKDLSGQINESVDNIKNEVSEDLFSEVDIFNTKNEKIISLVNGRDVYNKKYNDTTDEYNSKATDASQFSYKIGETSKLNVGNGEVFITDYLGNDENVVIPSIIEGRIVTRVNFSEFEGVKEVTIPDTVYTIMNADEITTIENINYNGTLIECNKYAFSNSPVFNKLTRDGLTILGKSLIMCTSTEKNITIPEGIESIPETENKPQFEEGPEVINFPSTFKYLFINFPESLQEVNTKSDFEEILGIYYLDHKNSPYIKEVEDEVYTFNNVLMGCAVDDPEKDIVFDENINRILKGCIRGNYHSLTFEAENIIADCPFKVANSEKDRINIGTLTFKNNAKKIVLNESGLYNIEQIILPDSVEFLSGNILDNCENTTLPSKVDYFLIHNPEECDNYQDHINYAKESGAIVIHK